MKSKVVLQDEILSKVNQRWNYYQEKCKCTQMNVLQIRSCIQTEYNTSNRLDCKLSKQVVVKKIKLRSTTNFNVLSKSDSF